jgi:hypothetical protein
VKGVACNDATRCYTRCQPPVAKAPLVFGPACRSDFRREYLQQELRQRRICSYQLFKVFASHKSDVGAATGRCSQGVLLVSDDGRKAERKGRSFRRKRSFCGAAGTSSETNENELVVKRWCQPLPLRYVIRASPEQAVEACSVSSHRQPVSY